MNSTIDHLLKRTAKIAVIVATFASFGVLASQATVSADSPVIYNETSSSIPNTPVTDTRGNGLKYSQNFELGGDSSNLGIGYDGAGPFTSILDINKYISLAQKSSTPVLYDVIKIQNDTGAAQNLNSWGETTGGLAIYLPYYNNKTMNMPYLNNQVSSQVIYAGNGNGDVSSTTSSTNGGSTTNDVRLRFGFDGHEETDPADFPETYASKLSYLRAIGSLQPNQILTIKIPLRIVKSSDPTTAISSPSDILNGVLTSNEDNKVTGFQSSSMGVNHWTLRIGLAVSQYMGISAQSTTNNYYLTIKNSENSSEPASDIQDFTPKVNSDNELAIADFGQDTHTAAANDTYLYKGGSYSVNTSKMKNAKDSSQSFIDMLHSNGYAIPNNQAYIDFPADYTPSSEIVSKLKTGDINLQVEKVIDAKGPITINAGSTWKPLDHVQILGTDGKKVDNAKVTTTKDNVNANVPGTYSVTYSYDYNGTPITKTIQVTVKGSSNNGGNGGGSSAGTVTTPTTNSGSTGTNTNGSTPSTTSPNTTSTIALPNYASKKGAAVYAVKAIYMYKHATFNKHQRIAKYPKQKRVNRPMFVITDYARSNGGALRYKVRDVNHQSKTAGKIGYITANSKYVVRVYYQSVPKNKKVTVIAKKGIHAYKNEALTGRTKSYKKGTRLTVKKLVKHNLTTRYELANGSYITANKKFVIQGKY